MTASGANRKLIDDFYVAFNANDLDGLDALVAPGLIDHHPGPGQPAGLPGLKKSLDDFHIAFPDIRVEPQCIVIDGDMAMVRSRCTGTNTGSLLGMAPTGRATDFNSIDNWRIENGLIVEVWHVEDVVKMLLQLRLMKLTPPATG